MIDSPPEAVAVDLHRIIKCLTYPEAIRDPNELTALIAYFCPHVATNQLEERMLLGMLNNPLNIEYISRLLNIACPPGYSCAEMEKRVNKRVPCPACGGMMYLYSSAYITYGKCCAGD